MNDKFSHNNSSKKEKNGHPYPGLRQESEISEELKREREGGYESAYALTDEIDHQILMHRDAHFGGDFGVMLAYYSQEEHIGIHPDFDLERILYLSEIEKEMGQDLAPLFLAGAEAEAVGRARQSYANFKDIYDEENEQNPIPRLIANLILTEEEEPLGEIGAVVSQGTPIVSDLISILKADDFYDPLFPGYGYAPYLAVICLGKIGAPEALIPIFETFSKAIIFDEMVIVDALLELGEPAKEFLLKIMKSRPLTQDNLNAAFALIAFSEDPRVANACFEQLHDPLVQETPLLRTYLLSGCQALNTQVQRNAFIKMAEDPQLPAQLRSDMRLIIDEWK